MALSIFRPSQVTERRNNADCSAPSGESQLTIFIVGDTSCYLGQAVSISGLGFEPREKSSVATPAVECQLIAREESKRLRSLSHLAAKTFSLCCNTSLGSVRFPPLFMIILRFLACLQPTENAHFLISKF
jgi:hypothetical protein